MKTARQNFRTAFQNYIIKVNEKNKLELENQIALLFNENNNNKNTMFISARKDLNIFSLYYARYMNSIISHDNQTKIITDNNVVNYCTNEKFSTTSHKLYSLNVKMFTSKIETDSFLKEFGCVPEHYSRLKKYDNNKLWFCKPNFGSCGNNIIISSNPINISDLKFVIQESIEPYLIKNRKWDMRIYVYFCIYKDKLYTYLYRDGFAKLAPEEYNSTNINKRSMLTNTSKLTLKDQKHINNIQFSIRKLDSYNIILDNMERLLSKIQDKMQLYINKIPNNKFILETHLMGFDVIVDKNNKLYILDVNTQPHTINKHNSTEIKNMKLHLYKDMYDIIKSFYINKHYTNDNFISIKN
jgi:hypothetical protein